MSETNYVPPALMEQAFNCPRCRGFTKQNWFYLTGANQSALGTQYQNKKIWLSSCESCGEPTIWHGLAFQTLCAHLEQSGKNINTDSDPSPGRQLKIALTYLFTLLVAFYGVLSNAGQNFNVAMAWLIIAVVSSQVVVDLAAFRSPKAKAIFSALYRILAAFIVLGIAYTAAD